MSPSDRPTPEHDRADARELRYSESPMFRAMVAALDALGLTAELARVRNGVLPPRDHQSWPHPDRKVRDAFHAMWTELMQQELGIDPRAAFSRWNPAPGAKPGGEYERLAPLSGTGRTITEAARELGMNIATARSIVQRHGLSFERLTQEQRNKRARAAALLAQGKRNAEVAKLVGISPETARRVRMRTTLAEAA